jgi:PAS domain S-box-containing protein
MSNLCKFEAMKELLACSDTYYLICVDNDGNYSYVNDRYAKKFGHLQDSFVNQPYDITIHPDDIRVFEELSAKCYASPGKLFPAAIRIANGNGGFIITQWEITLMTENGAPTGVFCLGHDAAEYEQVKDKYFLINNDEETKKEIVDAIAYEQSHIARAPLANILGLINVLKNYHFDPEAEVIINMLQQSSTLLDDVIRSIAKKPVTG